MDRPGEMPVDMASVPKTASPSDIQRIRRLLTITIAWMIAEAALSLFSAWRAHSPALVAFGEDSAIELISAVVVLWRFRGNAVPEQAEKCAAQVAGILLCPCRLRCACLSHKLARLRRTRANSGRNGRVILGDSRHALAGDRKTQTLGGYRQRRSASRCRGISNVCLSFDNCIAGSRS